MAFDKSLDVEKFKQTVVVGNSKLTISVHSYKGGTPKLQIGRSNKDETSQYGWTFAKQGRLTGAEIDAILPVIDQARKVM
jgi:hypothetical protein